MGIQNGKRAGFWRRTVGVRRALLAVVLLGVAILLRIAAQGLPDAWVSRLSDALSSDAYSVDLEDVTFSFRHGLSADRVRMAPVEPGSPPMLSLERATLRFAWRWGEPLLHWVRAIDVERAVLSTLPPRDSQGHADLPTFGPLRARCGQAEILGTSFRDVRAVVACRDSRLDVDNLRCDLSPPRSPVEAMEGEFSFGLADRRIRGAATGRLDPRRIVPLLRACGLHQLPQILERFAFAAEPAAARLHLDYAPADRHRRLEVALSSTACSYRGVPLTSASTTLVAEGADAWERVALRDLTLARPEGGGRGTLEFDLVRRGLRFSVSSTLDPKQLFALIGVFEKSQLDRWAFGAPAEVVAEGYYAYEGSRESTAITGVVRMPTLTVRKARFDNVEATFGVLPDRYVFPRFAATAYGGTCALTGTVFKTTGREHVFSVEGSLVNAKDSAIVEAVTGKALVDPGTLDLSLQLTGNLTTNTLRSLRGAGRARVRGAHLYRMPLFAGLTDFMARNIPGVDFVVSQNDLDAEFTVADFGMKFSQLRVEGSVFSIAGEGDYWFTDHLDIGVKIHLLKQRTWAGRLLKVALFPVSKLLEMELTGHLGAPKWSPTTLALRGRRDSTDEERGVQPPDAPPEGVP
jgi:hypothetical protein